MKIKASSPFGEDALNVTFNVKNVVKYLFGEFSLPSENKVLFRPCLLYSKLL